MKIETIILLALMCVMTVVAQTPAPTSSPTSCFCNNGGICVDGVCECEYPYFGTHCDSTKDCSEC